MNVLALRPRPADRFIPATADTRIARIAVFEDMAACEAPWRALEAGPLLATPYQRYDFLRLWQLNIGADEGVTPFIVTAFNAAGEPLFLWPLGRRSRGGLQVVEFLGGKHANFNMALWRRDVAAAIQVDDLKMVLPRVADRADLLMLRQQPLTWAGTTNPFALLPHQRAANLGFSGELAPSFDGLLRARTNATARASA